MWAGVCGPEPGREIRRKQVTLLSFDFVERLRHIELQFHLVHDVETINEKFKDEMWCVLKRAAC